MNPHPLEEKIIFRKLLSDCLVFFLLALFGISAIIWVFQAVNFLDIMIEDGRDYLVYFSYSILNFPKIFSRLFPFVLFFSLFYITLRYEMNNELLIFWNFGINKIEIITVISNGMFKESKTNCCNTIATKYNLNDAPKILEIKKKKAPVLWLTFPNLSFKYS